MIKVLPPKTAKEVVARERERKARTTLLMALPEDHLAKFHKMDDAKEMWEAIKSKFNGKGLHKGYDRFQTLLSQLEIHGAGVLHEDANQKFLSTNDVSTACSVSSPSVSKSQNEGSSSYTDEVLHSFFANQSSAPQLDYDDLEQINDDDMEEINLKWQTKVECFNCHKIRHFARDCRAKENQDSRRRDDGYNGNKARDNGRIPTYQDDSKALVTIDGEDIKWSGHVEKDTQNYAMMAYSSSNSSSENEVKSCSKTCEESYARLKKLYDEKRDKLGDASVEIIAYTLTLKKGNYMPSGPDVEIDYSKFTYGPKQALVDESDAKTSEYTSYESDSSVETTTSMPALVENAPKVVCEPKVWTDAPIIEEYESDSDDDSVSNVQEDKEKPSFAFTNSVKHVKTSRENVKGTSTPNHSPKVEKQDINGHTRNVLLREIGILLLRPQQVVIGETKEILRTKSLNTTLDQKLEKDDPHRALKDKGIVDIRCSRYMTGNKAYLTDYQEFKGGFVAFGGSNGRISGKGKTKAGRLDFEDVYYVEELKHYNLFSVSQMCDKKNKNSLKNEVAERKNMTLIEAARTMLADSFLPTTFWAEAVNTACYVLYRVLVTKPQNKKPYELLTGRQPIISYLRPFGCHVTILNTIEKLDKFDGKSDLGFLVRYSLNSKAFRVYNLESNRVEENLHVNFLENKPNVAGKGHAWMFDLDYLTNSMNYEPVLVENQANKSAGPKEANNSAEELEKLKRQEKEANIAARKESTHENQDANTNNTNLLNDVSEPISTAGSSRALNDGEPSYHGDPSMPHLEDIYPSPSEGIFTDSSYDDEGIVTDFNNLETTMNVSPTPTTRIHTIHPKTQILRDHMSDVQIRSKVNKNSKAHALKAIRTKWVYRNKKDERGVVVKNKARLVAQGHRQEEGIDYDEVFAHVARIEAIRIFLAFASYMGFIVYQIDVKSAFLYGIIDEEVYVTQPPSFVDPKFPNKVYKVVKALYGLNQAPKAWQDKYVAEILKKFDFLSVKTASTPIETQKPFKDEKGADVDNQLLDYGFNLMNTKIHIDNESTICIVKNPVFHFKTKHTEIQHHFIRDAYEKKLIQVLKIHTDDNVADLLTKDFDVSRFNFLVVNIRLLNL
nr:retrovirus-related Pol polyprotein from transposon TNT 1-94 [Tanacetum cinerariifolium]